MMKVAIVYDRVNKWGGAERVLLALHELFPDAPLYTSVYDKKGAPWASVFTVKTSFIQKFPFASSKHEYLAMLMPLAFEGFSFDEYDAVISVTSEAAKGIITKPHTVHICYCLTPTRYLWSGYKEYFKNKLFAFIAQPIIGGLRMWDTIAAKRPDAYISISGEVQKRVKEYYGEESEVVYPPVEMSNAKYQISNQFKNTKYKIPDTKYFLVVSRLVPYKRIDLAIKACNALSLPLVVVGTGVLEQELKDMAGKTVTFVNNLTDEELWEYYMGCIALIVPGVEDFGLTALEAQSVGKPVISYNGGGARETILSGKTGIFFEKQTVGALTTVLKEFDPKKFNTSDCQKQAKKFEKEAFKINFMYTFKKLMEGKE